MAHIPKSIQILLDDNISGSVTLLKRLMSALETELLSNPDPDPAGFINMIHLVRKRMETFTVIRHFCDELILSHNISMGDYPGNYLDFISDYKLFWERAPQQLVNNLLGRIKLKNRTVMLHSNSGTIREVFSLLSEKDLGIRIIQTLAAPAEEGRVQAHDLAKQGFHVTLIPDAMAALKMQDTDYLILGADQVRQKTIVNKTGSLQMILAAQQYSVPVCVLTESRKSEVSDPSDPFQDRPRDKKEIIDEIVHPNIFVENKYFEEIPRYFIDHLVTEKSSENT